MSGSISDTSQNKTYSDSFISFKYPSDFNNSTVPTYLTSGDSKWTTIVYFNNSDEVGILVYNIQTFQHSITTESAAQNTLDSQKQLNGSSILSSVPQTNPHGLKMWKTISTVKDPLWLGISQEGTMLIYFVTYFKQGDNMYAINVYGKKNNKGDIQKVADTVFNITTINWGWNPIYIERFILSYVKLFIRNCIRRSGITQIIIVDSGGFYGK